jgi:N-acetylglutamate synthase-like GNAT family acetyltransferase
VRAQRSFKTMRIMASTITTAKPEHAQEIADLVNHAYRGDGDKKGWTTEAYILDGIRTDRERVTKDIVSKNSAILIKHEDEKIVGCVHLERKDETTAYLGMLTTDVTKQTQGTGKQLMLASEEFVKKVWGCDTIEMTVIDSRHELISYYVRRGYQLTEEKRPFPNDPAFGIPKAGPLEFVVLTKKI